MVSVYAQTTTPISELPPPSVATNTPDTPTLSLPVDAGASERNISPVNFEAPTPQVQPGAPGGNEKALVPESAAAANTNEGAGVGTTLNRAGTFSTQSAVDETDSFSGLVSTQNPSGPDYMSGAVTYSVPIAIPPGRNGMQPNVQLTYNSQRADQSSIVGYGWELSIPYIQRLNKQGWDSIYDEDDYYSSLSGDLATTSVLGTFQTRSEDGQFLQYTYATTTGWTVKDKKGVVYTFGSSTLARQDDPANPSHVYKWMLTEVRDSNGNFVTYQYIKDGNQIYPSTITYTNSASSTGIFSIEFSRESRPDNATSTYLGGFGVKSAYRISEIISKVNGVWTQKYTLAYLAGDNGRRSLLAAVTQSGQDEKGVLTTLPPTTFNYQSSTTTKGWVENPQWGLPIGLALPSVFLSDYSGDGLLDVIYQLDDLADSPNAHAKLNLGTGNWSEASTTWYEPGYMGVPGWRMGDMNGDGWSDAVYSSDDPMFTFNRVYINVGAGWVLSTSTVPIPFNNAKSTFLIDVNGDGLSDAVQSYTSGQEILQYNRVFINDGNGGWMDESTTTWQMPPLYMNAYGNRMFDVNGDGLPDILRKDNTTGDNRTYINTGHGWIYDEAWSHLPRLVDPGAWFIDVNGDGIPDILFSADYGGTAQYEEAYIGDGYGGFNLDTGWVPPLRLMGKYNMPVDLNGDGMPDMLDSFNLTVRLNKALKADLLSQVTTPTGAKTSFGYKMTTAYRDVSGGMLNPHLQYPLLTVNTITTNDGFGNVATTTYEYKDGVNYYASAFDHQLGGFGLVTKTDTFGNVTKTYFHTGGGTDAAHGEYADSRYKIGRAYRTEVYDDANRLYSKTIYRWDSTPVSTNAAFVYLAQAVESSYDGGSTHKDSAEQYTYDSTGNLTLKKQYGQVQGNDDGTYGDVGSDLVSTTYTYAANGSTATGFLASALVQDQSSTKVREARYYYDNLSLGSVTVGNQTKGEDWISGSLYASTTKTYGMYGFVVGATNQSGGVTTYVPDTYYLYPATTTNPLNQSTSYQYNYALGKVIRAVDPNGSVSTTTYDGLGRPLFIGVTDPQTGALVTRTVYAYTDSATPGGTKVAQTDYQTAATSTATYTYFDTQGKPVQKRVQVGGNNTYAITDTIYNRLGLVGLQSLPYFASSTGRTGATTTIALYSTYFYDALWRVIKVTDGVGSTTYTYKPWQTTVVDPRSNPKLLQYDAYKNLATVVEFNATSTGTTTYAYDASNNLVNVTDAQGNTRAFTYDGLGRRTSAQDLHAPGDPTFGTWAYVYDAANLRQSVDPKGQVVNYTYDVLNRPLTEDYTGSPGTEVLNTYDSCSKGIGQLCAASSTSAYITYTYNPLGLRASETAKIVGTTTTFTTSYLYDQIGNQTYITYPDGSKVQYVYTSGNQIDAVFEKEGGVGTATTTIVSKFTYAPTGDIATVQYGNGATTTNRYDANTLYRLASRVTATPTAGRAQDLTYTYDTVGNITQITDASNSATNKVVRYAYDALNRLTAASTTSATTTPDYSYSYTYDKLGNITSGPAGVYAYLGNVGSTYANPHALTALYVATSTRLADTIATSTILLESTSTNISSGLTGTTTKTWVHPTVSSKALVVLSAEILGHVVGGGFVGSSTWNGSPLGRIRYTRNGVINTEVWYTVATTSGPGVLSVNITGDSDAIKLNAASFVGVATTSPLVASNVVGGSSGNPPIALPMTPKNALVVAVLTRNSTTSATTNRTAISNDTTGPILSASSYQLATTSGTTTDTYTGAAAQGWTMIMVAFKAATTTVFGGFGTTTATTTLVYDQNGNLLSEGVSTYAWDYKNRLVQSGDGVATSTYGYDQNGTRVKTVEKGYTTLYPNKLYNVMLGGNATTTKHIFANNLLLATVENIAAPLSGWVSTSTIAIAATSTNVTVGFASSTVRTWTHMVTAPNSLVVLYADILQNTATGTVSSATLNGAAFTKATSTLQGTMDAELWYVLAITSGSKTVVVNVAGNTNAIKLAAASFIGTTLVNPLGNTTKAVGTTGSPTISITPAAKTDLLTTTLSRNGTSDATSTALSIYKDNLIATLGAASYQFATTTKAYTDTYLGATTTNWALVAATFKPATTTVGAVATSTLRYFATDNLSGANVVMDTTGTIVETLDYYPYGALRIDTKAGAYTGEKRKYAGTEYDAGSGLNYMNARYYEGSRGQFLSQDPVFWEVGQTKDGIRALSDPQSMNSYSYAGNNPITQSDPNGRWYKEFVTGQQSFSSFYGEVGEAANYLGQSSPAWNYAMNNPYTTGAVVGVGSGLAAYGASAALTSLSVDALSGIGTRSMGNLSRLESLPQTTQVPGKLDLLSQQTGKSVGQLLQEASQSGKPYIDFRNGGNINILNQSGLPNTLSRITTNPQITKIISAGRMETSQVSNLVRSGNMQGLQSTLSGLSKVLGQISKLLSK